MKELTFLKESILIRQVDQKSAISPTISIFLDKRFKFQSYVCNDCHDVLMMSKNLSDIAIVNIHGVDYCCIISGINKNEAISLMQNIGSSEKSRTLQNIKIYNNI